MDRTAIIVVTICVILLFTWPALMEKISPSPPAQPQPINAPPIQVPGQANTPTSAPLGQAQTAQAPVSSDFQPPVKLDSPKLSILETEESSYIFTSAGGLKTVELKEPHVVMTKNTDLLWGTNNGDVNSKLIKLNHGVDLPVFSLEGVDDSEFSINIDRNLVTMVSTNQAGIRISKQFRADANYLLHTTITLANPKTEPVTLPQRKLMLGTAMPLQSGGGYPVWGAQWGYNDDDMEEIDEGWFDNYTLGCIPGTPRPYFMSAGQPVNWVGVHNRFFALTTIPMEGVTGGRVYSIKTTPVVAALDKQIQNNIKRIDSLEGRTAKAESQKTKDEFQQQANNIKAENTKLSLEKRQILGVETGLTKEEALDPDPQEEHEQHVHDTCILASLQFEAQVLQPGESIIQEFTTYAGPKEYQVLLAHGQTYENSIDLVMGYNTPVFGLFAKLLLRSMNGLHSFGLGYAMCIIVITIIIKILFWPLTKASTVSMKRLAAYGPQMAEIKAKYKEDPQKMNKRTMEFMREHKINPLGGCLPILIQIPVFIGFFTMLRTAVELRGAKFLWACDLSQSDTVAEIAGFPINPLPMIMGVTMLLQARLTPVSPTADPTQQKIMKYMPLMFIVILYNFSAGLTLYWTVQNMLSILQTKLTKNIVVEAPLKSENSPLVKPIKNKRKRKK